MKRTQDSGLSRWARDIGRLAALGLAVVAAELAVLVIIWAVSP